MDRFIKSVGDRLRGLREREPEATVVEGRGAVDAEPVVAPVLKEAASEGEDVNTQTDAAGDTTEDDRYVRPEAQEASGEQTTLDPDAAQAFMDTEAASEEEQAAAPEDEPEPASEDVSDDVPDVTVDGVEVNIFTSSDNDDEPDSQDSDEFTLSDGDDTGTITIGEGTLTSGEGFTFIDGVDDDDSDDFVLSTDGEGETITIVADAGSNDGSGDESEDDEPESSAIDYPYPEPEDEPESSVADYPEDQSETDPTTPAEHETIAEQPPGRVIGVVSEVVTSDARGSIDPRLEPVVSHERIAGLDVLEEAQISLPDDDDEALTADDLIEKPSKPDNQPAPGTIPAAPDLSGSPAGGQPSSSVSHLDLETESEAGDGGTIPSPLDYQLAEDPRVANIEYRGDLIVTDEDDDQLVPVDDGIDRPEVENVRAPGEAPPSPGPKSADLDVINTTVMAGDSEAGEPSKVIDQSALAGDSEAGEPSKHVDLISSGDGDVSDPSKTLESQKSPALQFDRAPEVARVDTTIDFASAPELKQQPGLASVEMSIPAPPVEPELVTQVTDVAAVTEIEPVVDMDVAAGDDDDSDDDI